MLSSVEERQFRLKRGLCLDKVEGLEGTGLPMRSQLPSWVPDWEVHRPSSSFILHPNFATMNAAGTTQASCTFSLDGLMVLPRGIEFDQVS